MDDLTTKSTEAFSAILQEALGALLHTSMHSMFHYIRARSLSISQIFTLASLHRKGVRGVSEIGERLGISSAAASQMLERLVQQELIVRTEDPADRRSKQITLTEAGREVIQDSFRMLSDWLDTLSGRLTPTEREQIGAALSILVERAKQLEGTTHECETKNRIMNHES